MTEPRRAPNPIALTLIGVGAVLGALAFSVLDWFDDSLGVIPSDHSTAGEIGDLLDQLATRRQMLGGRGLIHLGISQYYYSWLGWLLLGAAVIVAFVAALPTEEGGRIRILGGMLAFLGIGATLWAIELYRPSHDRRVQKGPSFTDFLGHTSAGAWSALAAFVLIGIGASLGPRRSRQTDSSAASATSSPEIPSTNSTESR